MLAATANKVAARIGKFRQRSTSCGHDKQKDSKESEYRSSGQSNDARRKTAELPNEKTARSLFGDARMRLLDQGKSASQSKSAKPSSRVQDQSLNLSSTKSSTSTLKRTKSASQADKARVATIVRSRVTELSRSRNAMNLSSTSDVNANLLGTTTKRDARSVSSKRGNVPMRSREQDRALSSAAPPDLEGGPVLESTHVEVNSSGSLVKRNEDESESHTIASAGRALEPVVPFDRIERRMNLLYARYAQSLYLATRSSKVATELQHRLPLLLASLQLENASLRRQVLLAEQTVAFYEALATSRDAADSQVQSLLALRAAVDAEPFASRLAKIGELAEARRNFFPLNPDHVALTADGGETSAVSESQVESFNQTLRDTIESRAEASASPRRYSNTNGGSEKNANPARGDNRHDTSGLPSLALTIAQTIDSMDECVQLATAADTTYARESSLLAECIERRLLDLGQEEQSY